MRDAVTGMGRNQEMIAGLKGLLIFRELQRGAAAEQGDPFIMILIVPETRRARLGMGKDALDFCRRIFQKGEEFFTVSRMR